MMTQVCNKIAIIGFLFVGTGCIDLVDWKTYQYRFESNITVGGVLRTYVINLPGLYYNNDATVYPLVIALHGAGGSARQMEASYGLNEKANQEGFVVVYPEGVRNHGVLGIRTWNAGKCCEYAMENNIDDVGFIDKLIDSLIANFQIDEKRIYVTGMSNGGMMTYRLACELSQRIAAIAPVSATMIMDKPCQPERAMPILHLHSLLDAKVPYAGGIGIGNYYFPPVDSVLNSWSLIGECSTIADVTDNYQFTKSVWSNCSGDLSIESYTTYDGGHSWPGGKQTVYWADLPSTAIIANDAIWEFFQRHKLQ